MHKFNRNDSIVERHFGVGTIAHRILLRYYLAYFEKCTPHIVKEKNLHKYNKKTGEIS